MIDIPEGLQILATKDGSDTLFNVQLNETYHSINGAMQESMHVFIGAGLHHFVALNPSIKNIKIVELGFGTGLNAILTFMACKKLNISCQYIAVERFPLDYTIAQQLNYKQWMSEIEHNIFVQMHTCAWNINTELTNNFLLHKSHSLIEQVANKNNFEIGIFSNIQIVYMDAFDPAKQPELWTAEVFKNIFDGMNKQGVLVTYSSKGDVKRAMQQAGFSLEKIAGPIGKRHMLRAQKK